MAFQTFSKKALKERRLQRATIRVCGDVPRPQVCEILYYYKKCACRKTIIDLMGLHVRSAQIDFKQHCRGRISSGRDVVRTKTVTGPYVPSRVVREGALMSSLLPAFCQESKASLPE